MSPDRDELSSGLKMKCSHQEKSELKIEFINEAEGIFISFLAAASFPPANDISVKQT